MGEAILIGSNLKSNISMKITPKTIYTDLVDLPDPMLLGLTLHYYNHSDDMLYMKITLTATNFSDNSHELGSLASGGNARYNWDNASSRAKPSAETTETLHLLLEGYSDVGYTTLVYSFARDVTIIMIKSDDDSWTEDELDNFDDGTVQDWAAAGEAGVVSASVSVVTDYVLSPPYSLKLASSTTGYLKCTHGENRSRIYKTFETSDKNEIFAIMNIRVSSANSFGETDRHHKYLEVRKKSDVLVHLGKLYDIVLEDYFPPNKWIRIVVPLPKNTTVESQIAADSNVHGAKIGYNSVAVFFMWLDDFKIISRD